MAARRKKLPIRGEGLVVKAYPVLRAAVEAGVAYGFARAHKHTDEPTPDAIRDAIEEAVVGEICERFDFTEAR